MAQTELETAISELSLTISAEFVPFSKSRNAKPNPRLNERSLNWRVTLYAPQTGEKPRPGATRKIIEIDYQAGIGYCPSYKNDRITVSCAEAIEHETEAGRPSRGGKPILPKIADVVYSLVLDASAIDEPDFENWATDLGYDSDSRSAEKIYQQCVKIGLTLRNLLGENALAKLQDASQDY